MAGLHDDEMNDYRTALTQLGRSETEFEITTVEPHQAGSGPDTSPVVGRVRIRNRLTGSSKGYATGQGTNWIARFRDDLAAGAL